MNYAKILTADITSGPGFRVSMWVTGCEHRCEGCFNSEIWECSKGQKFDQGVKDRIFAELGKPWVSGFSFLGGEPLSKLSDNREQTIAFCKELKAKFPTKDVVVFTGFMYEDLVNDETSKELFDYIDILVDGKFEIAKRDVTLGWRGSTNQRIIDVKRSSPDNVVELRC